MTDCAALHPPYVMRSPAVTRRVDGAQRNPPIHRSPSALSFSKVESLRPCARPIFRVNPARHIAFKRRMRPIPHSFYPAMLNGIEMNVIDMIAKIRFVSDRVLPKPALPNSPLVTFAPIVADALHLRQGMRKLCLDPFPASKNRCRLWVRSKSCGDDPARQRALRSEMATGHERLETRRAVWRCALSKARPGDSRG
jgi:hypothetical protein